MCGIAGILRHDQSITPDDLTVVQRMMTAQVHRGPDGDGIVAIGKLRYELKDTLPAASRVDFSHLSSSVVFGHRRLAIIDLSDAGRQPLSNEDGTVWLTYNGEVYNYQALREDLVRVGHRFASHTDSEVIVHGYEEWGIEELLTRLRGMFAFALYDARADWQNSSAQTARLILARDRLGIKPLYYACQATRVLFASEVRALLVTGLISRGMDSQALIRFLQLGSVPVPLTTARDIQALPAGHYAIADHTGVKLYPYWCLSAALTRTSGSAAYESEALVINTTRALLDEAVGLHLLSDVPIGVFLSGGIDSSSLVGLATPRRSTPLTTISVGFTEAEYDETCYARLVAEQYQTFHHEMLLNFTDCFSVVPQILAAMDQPSADGVNTYFVAKAAKQLGVTVALSGIGGDEVFLGYEHLKRAPLLGNALTLLRTLPLWARHTVLSTGACAGVALGKIGADKLHALALPSNEHMYLLFRGLFTPLQIQKLLGVGEHEIVTLPSLSPYESGATSQTFDTILLLLEFYVYLQSQLLKDADCMGMVHSLEIRVPLLDHQVVEYILGVPLGLKRGRGINKPLLVRALGDILPRSIWDRPKQGFTFPFARWLQQHGEELEANTKESRLFEKGAVENVWREFRTGRLHWSRPWALLTLSQFATSKSMN